jgi:hypothetical protein
LVVELVHAAHARLLFGDFRAFYCGGRAVLEGQNPYATSALLPCESAPQPFALYSAHDGVAVPAPFPGYALLAFAAFAWMPYPLAAALWLLALCAALFFASRGIADLTGFPSFGPLVAVGVGAIVAVIPFGELAPIAMWALVGAAQKLRRGRDGLAAAALAVFAILPHVALPSFVALFAFRRSARMPLVVLAAVLGIADLCVGGPHLALRYFTTVLPAHALSEVGSISQYGTTWIAQALGASDRTAILAGNVWYALMCVCGVLAARAFARRFDDPAALLLVPVALAVAGSGFIHYAEITLALPAAFLLASALRGERPLLGAVAVLLIAVPWAWIVEDPTLAIVFAGTAFCVPYFMLEDAARSLRISFGAVAYCGAALLFAHVSGPAMSSAHVRLDPSLAQASWARFMRGKHASQGAIWWLLKIPTWLGLYALAGSASERG